MIAGVGGTRLFVYRSQHAGTNKATAVTWVTDEVEDIVKTLKGCGVSFEHYDLPNMTASRPSRGRDDEGRMVQGPGRQYLQPCHAAEHCHETNRWGVRAVDGLEERTVRSPASAALAHVLRPGAGSFLA
jgi:hypothetical protein